MPCSKRFKPTHLWEPQRVLVCFGILCAILDPALKRSEAGLQCLLPLLGRLRVKSMRDLWKGLKRTVPFGAFIGTVVPLCFNVCFPLIIKGGTSQKLMCKLLSVGVFYERALRGT
jgi:hypothetical protein